MKDEEVRNSALGAALGFATPRPESPALAPTSTSTPSKGQGGGIRRPGLGMPPHTCARPGGRRTGVGAAQKWMSATPPVGCKWMSATPPPLISAKSPDLHYDPTAAQHGGSCRVVGVPAIHCKSRVGMHPRRLPAIHCSRVVGCQPYTVYATYILYTFFCDIFCVHFFACTRIRTRLCVLMHTACWNTS